MFKRFYSYTHKNMLDAAIYVMKQFRLENGDYVLKIKWMNRRGLDLNLTETVRIKQNEVKNWYVWEN